MRMAGVLPPIRSASNCAVASEVVMPRPSCPVARKTVLSSAEGPIKGSLSGVAERKPVHVRWMVSDGNAGRYSAARSKMRASICVLHFPALYTILAGGPDKKLAVRSGLHIAGYGISGCDVSALQISELDYLVA